MVGDAARCATVRWGVLRCGHVCARLALCVVCRSRSAVSADASTQKLLANAVKGDSPHAAERHACRVRMVPGAGKGWRGAGAECQAAEHIIMAAQPHVPRLEVRVRIAVL